jgi:glutamate dehydrogenase
MSGDVFGNGMLLSRHIKLVGAFNHLHVFLDPDPDPEVSFAERERLFALPRSSWSDYDSAKISEGGGVWPRSAKSIPLSEQARQVLGVEAKALTPNELVNAVLKAPVDLLWNGGIGTYVKARSEAHSNVGDRTNDAVRVDGAELRAKVVGEGGNLGFTQLGRIEYALAGGRINTDFIDNSGGVDCSDHEVNIKILLNQVVNDGDMTRKQRDKLLADMTEDVATAVLQDNYRQVQAISVTEAQAPQLLDEHARLMRSLERAKQLDRRLEFLPNNEELAERKAAGRGLTRPELAVLLAYAKIVLQEELVASDVPEDEYLADDLERYMPPKLREKFRKQLRRHPLRRDIIATYVTNSMVNRAGSTFASRLRDETGASPPDVARAYTVAREVFDIRRLWKDLATLDTVVPADVQIELQAEGRKMIERSALWFLRNRRQPMDIAATVSRFAPGIASLAQELPKLLAPADSESLERLAEQFTAAGVPAELATRVASLDALFSGLNVIEVATACGESVETVAAVYFALGYKLDLHWLRDQIAKLPADTHWQTLAQGALRDDLYSEQRELTIEVLRRGPEDRGEEDADAETLIETWLEENRSSLERASTLLSDLREADTLDIAMISVALREIRNLAETGVATTGAPAAR